MSLRSPLGRVLGLGTAKDGTSHWWGQRVSAVALLILGVWFAWYLATTSDFSYAAVVAEIGRPIN
ncbi:MAG: succinate dehydrogenase, hydrophobic membrane anchor protein, partial [Gammaproteobacteria bacterium]|nr:succinate dehydrogenase, hydrophobic membrane anchor protein [Gammaproteobacteria bacterium]